MNQISKDVATQLRFDFYKSVLTFALATLGGEVTLLHSLFKDSPGKGVAYGSIIAIMFSCLFVIGAKETLIKRLDPLPKGNGLLAGFLAAIEITSPTAERLLLDLSGALYGLGLIMFIGFVLQ